MHLLFAIQQILCLYNNKINFELDIFWEKNSGRLQTNRKKNPRIKKNHKDWNH